MAKIFSKFGAKRSENLGDLGSTSNALNTLLDRIKGGAESFTSLDLEVIKGIFSSDINSNVFTNASNTTVQFTGPAGTNITYEPLITLSNRFDRAYFTTSEPFFFGGDGLTARYYNSDGILRNTPGDASTSFQGFDNYVDPITGRPTIDPLLGRERAVSKNNFWEEGEFEYNQKLSPNLTNFYGGVEWSGFFKPTENGVWSLRITTTGFLRVEFDTKEAPSKGFTFETATGTFRLNDLDFNNGSGLQTLVDQTRLTSAGIIDNEPDGFSSVGSTIPTELNQNYGTITGAQYVYSGATGTGASFNVRRDNNGDSFITLVDGGSGYVLGETITIPFSLVGGADASDDIVITIDQTRGWYFYDELAANNTGVALGTNRTFQVDFGELKAFNPYKIRISFFYDNDAVDKSDSQIQGDLDRRIIFEKNSPTGGQDDDIDYKYLYPEDYFDFYQIGNFKEFIDESINFSGSRVDNRFQIGLRSAPSETDGDKYLGLSNLNPIVSYYIGDFGPVSNQIQIRTGNTTSGSTLISFPTGVGNNVGLFNKTEFLKVGNYLIGTGIPVGARITDINNDLSVIIDRKCTATGQIDVEFVEHEGLVAFGLGGRYLDNVVPATGLNENGFALGLRGFDVARIISGDTVDLDLIGDDYGTFTVGPNVVSDTDGENAEWNISRNNNGSLVVTTTSSGVGYSNFELFEVDGDLIGQPGTNLVFECATLTDTFLTGKPRLIFQKDQMLKQEDWTETFQYRDKTVAGQEEPGTLRTSSETVLIDRFQLGAEGYLGETENSFVIQDQTIDLVGAGLTGSDRRWFVYQTFGLNNDGLASYCQGVYDKRILPLLTISTAGGAYSSEALPSGSSVAVSTTGPGTNMQVYYVTDIGGVMNYAWVDPENAGSGYEPGDIIRIPGATPEAEFTVDYNDTSSSVVTFRVPNTKDLQTGMYAHLFPSLSFTGTDVNNLFGNATITSLDPITASVSKAGGPPQDTAALVQLTVPAGAVQNNPISYVDSVITRITFTPVGDTVNKEVCFRPTDTSPPFAATSRGLATINDVKMVLDFTSLGGGNAGVFNTSSTISYDKLEMTTDSSNEIATVANDFMAGYIPITAGDNNTYYLLLQGTSS